VQKLDCRKDIHDRAYLSIGVTSGIGTGLYRVPGDGCFQGYRGEAMHYLGYELPRIPIPRTLVNKPLYKRRRGALNVSPLLLLWGLGPPAKPAWGSYIDPPPAYLLTGCGPPFSMALACCRRNSLSRRRRGVTVYPGLDAAIDVKLQSAWLPPLEVIDVKACCRVSAG
jgi:hypothetical protein